MKFSDHIAINTVPSITQRSGNHFFYRGERKIFSTNVRTIYLLSIYILNSRNCYKGIKEVLVMGSDLGAWVRTYTHTHTHAQIFVL